MTKQEISHVLHDWRGEDDTNFADLAKPVTVKFTLTKTNVLIKDDFGRAIMIELEGQFLRMHGYFTDRNDPVDEPISVSLEGSSVVIETSNFGQGRQHSPGAEAKAVASI